MDKSHLIHFPSCSSCSPFPPPARFTPLCLLVLLVSSVQTIKDPPVVNRNFPFASPTPFMSIAPSPLVLFPSESGSITLTGKESIYPCLGSYDLMVGKVVSTNDTSNRLVRMFGSGVKSTDIRDMNYMKEYTLPVHNHLKLDCQMDTQFNLEEKYHCFQFVAINRIDRSVTEMSVPHCVLTNEAHHDHHDDVNVPISEERIMNRDQLKNLKKDIPEHPLMHLHKFLTIPKDLKLVNLQCPCSTPMPSPTPSSSSISSSTSSSSSYLPPVTYLNLTLEQTGKGIFIYVTRCSGGETMSSSVDSLMKEEAEIESLQKTMNATHIEAGGNETHLPRNESTLMPSKVLDPMTPLAPSLPDVGASFPPDPSESSSLNPISDLPFPNASACIIDLSIIKTMFSTSLLWTKLESSHGAIRIRDGPLSVDPLIPLSEHMSMHLLTSSLLRIESQGPFQLHLKVHSLNGQLSTPNMELQVLHYLMSGVSAFCFLTCLIFTVVCLTVGRKSSKNKSSSSRTGSRTSVSDGRSSLSQFELGENDSMEMDYYDLNAGEGGGGGERGRCRTADTTASNTPHKEVNLKRNSTRSGKRTRSSSRAKTEQEEEESSHLLSVTTEVMVNTVTPIIPITTMTSTISPSHAASTSSIISPLEVHVHVSPAHTSLLPMT